MLVFYLILLLISFAFLPVARVIFKNTLDSGFPFSKIIGLVFLTYISLFSKYLFKINLDTFSLLLIVSVVLLIGGLKGGFKKLNWKPVIIEEFIFCIVFVGMLLFRGANPQIEGIEKFMDFGIINGLIRSETIPPEDIWFSGSSINYYYFGHFVIATLITITKVPSAVGYNYTVAFLLAGIFSSVYSINLYLTKKIKYSILGAAVLTMAGNLDYLFNFTRPNYFYAQARGLIPHTINEFPAYSFLISDLHAHIINLIFVALFLGLLVYYFVEYNHVAKIRYLIFLAMALGVLGVTNTWDFIVYLGLACATVTLSYLKERPKLKDLVVRTIFTTGFIALVSIIMFFPFYLYFRPAVSGIATAAPIFKLVDIFRMFGFFFIALAPFYVLIIAKRSLFKLASSQQLIFVFITVGLCLVFLPEVIIVKDIYFKLNPPYARANTVFKFWYQAWVLLSVSVPVAFIFIKTQVTNMKIKVGYVVLISMLSIFIFGYTIKGVKTIVGSEYKFKTLDGSAYLINSYKGEYNIIKWLNTNVEGTPVVLEAHGSSYSMNSLISAYTGLPTVVGWSDHELGWRDNWPLIATRLGDVEKLYKSNSVEEINILLRKYNMKYVVIGSNEYKKFGRDAGSLLKKMLKPVLIDNNVSLLSN